MSLEIIAILMIVLLFVLFILGLEIGITMAIVGFLGSWFMMDFQVAFDTVARDFYAVFASYGFTVIPIFIAMGMFGASAGVSKDLYRVGNRWVGHIPGGLALGTIFAATAFKAICGSINATIATFGTIAVPEMDRYGYDKRLSCGTVATVGTLGGLLPPSVGLVIYGLITQTSIGRLFMAGIIPGLIVALVYAGTVYTWCKWRPNLGPAGERSTWKERFEGIPSLSGVIIIFIVVIGGLTVGYFTPTEAASIGAAAVLILTVLKREMSWEKFVGSMMDSIKLGAMVLTLIAGGTVLGHAFALTRLPFVVGNWTTTLGIPASATVMLMLLVILIGGSFIEDSAFYILVLPIFFPIIQQLGYDPVWFGIVTSTTMMIGSILPPIAVCVFVASGVTKVPLSTVYKGIYPFLWGLVLCNLLFLFVPQLSLFLPNLIYGR